MNYRQLDDKRKAQIDILLKSGLSQREVGRKMKISHFTVSRYVNKFYTKRVIDINKKYKFFIDYLIKNYNYKNNSIDVCIYKFKRYHHDMPCVSTTQVYNWIKNNKIAINTSDMCYKRRKRKSNIKSLGMMNHLKWNITNKTVLPISLRPKVVQQRKDIGHLEIDSPAQYSISPTIE